MKVTVRSRRRAAQACTPLRPTGVVPLRVPLSSLVQLVVPRRQYQSGLLCSDIIVSIVVDFYCFTLETDFADACGSRRRVHHMTC